MQKDNEEGTPITYLNYLIEADIRDKERIREIKKLYKILFCLAMVGEGVDRDSNLKAPFLRLRNLIIHQFHFTNAFNFTFILF